MAADGGRDVDALDARAIGDLLGLSARSVRRRADREEWPSESRIGVGGKSLVYPIATLPPELRSTIERARALQAAAAAPVSVEQAAGKLAGAREKVRDGVDALVATRWREKGQAEAAALRGARKARMEAKLDLLSRLTEFARVRGLGVCAAMDEFCDLYNSGALDVGVAVRMHTGADLHPCTLRRWRQALAERGPSALAGDYGNRRGSGYLDSHPPLREFALGVLSEKPHIRAKTLFDLLGARFGEAQLSRRSLERWLSAWKRDNAELFLSLTNPDGWKNKYMAAFGSYSEGVVRANQLWMMDSTPADVMLDDGRHSILGVIDVATRRVMFLVSRTSTADAVCRLMRRAILAWGVPEAVKLDNGRDYASEKFARLLTALSIESRFSHPFSGWEKPFIERVFGTLTRHCFELLPGYTGHSVADAQAIRARKSFQQRLEQRDAIELRMTAAELQMTCDRWVEDYYQHESHSGEGMDGLTPFEKTAQLRDGVRVIGDERALDLLLGDGELRTVTKKGVRLGKLTYIAPELGAAVGREVLVRRDEGDMGRAVIYLDDAFLCVAECPAVTGINRMEVSAEAKRRQREALKDARAAARRARRKVNDGDLAQELLADRARKARALDVLPAENVVHITPALEAAAQAAKELEAWEAGDAERRAETEAVRASQDRVVREFQRSDETAERRFREALDQMQQLAAGALDELAQRRLAGYQETPEFQTRWIVFSDFGAKWVGLPETYNALLPEDALFLNQKG